MNPAPANDWPKSVIIIALSEYRGFMLEVARAFQLHGSAVHWLVSTEQERSFYADRHGDLFASIAIFNRLYRAAGEPVKDRDQCVAVARRNEKKYGVTYNTLAMSDRHFGRGFALGGFGHPRSRFSETVDYVSVLHAYNETIAFWEDQIGQYDPDVVISGGKVASVVCRYLDIPYRSLVESKFKNFHFWAVDEFYENPEFEKRYQELAGTESDLELEAPYDTHLQMRGIWTKSFTFSQMLKNFCHKSLQRLYWRIRRYEKAKSYYLSSQLAHFWRRYRDFRELQRLTAPLSALKGTQFVYYPLHTEPETAVQLISPEYFYQLSSIAALARDLPAGAILAVKETLGGIGRRPRDFYRQIAEFKNVVLLDPFEYGLSVVAEASAVATITGTGGFEGAVLGKPVATFGRHNMYKFLNHAAVIVDETELAPFLEYALDSAFDTDSAKRGGKRFLQAVVDCSFDLKEFDVTDPDSINQSVIEDAMRNLVENLALRSHVVPAHAGGAVPRVVANRLLHAERGKPDGR